MKRCPQCEAIKDLSSFDLDRTKKDGHYGICKECRRTASPANRRAILPFEPEPWAVEGACHGANPDLFFPERGASTREAKEVCATCPVRLQCLEYAIRTEQKFGIWGGLSERERRPLRRRRKQQVAS